MQTDLTTTNVLLGILAAVSLLEALAVVGLFAAGYFIFRRLMQVIDGIEARQVAPTVARVNAILDDVHEVTSAARTGATGVARLARWIGPWR